MNRKLRILMLEDALTDAEIAEHELRKAGLVFTSMRVDRRAAFISALEEFHPDIVLADYRLLDFDGMNALEIVQRDYPDVPVVLVTGVLPDIGAVELIHAGAKDYVLKDRLARLAPAVLRTLAEAQSTQKRRQAEAQLLVSEEKYRLLFESSRDALMTLAPPSWRFTSANAATLQLFGMTSAAEFMALGPWDVSPERQPDGLFSCEKARQMISIAMREGSHSFEWEHRQIGGKTFTADVLFTRIEAGGLATLQATVRDITERKQAEENLRITASVFGNSQEAIMITDVNNAIMDVNPAFTRITGYTRNEVVGKNPKLLSSGRQDQEFYARMWRSLEQNRAWRDEIWNRRKSGEVYAEQLSISAICDSNGKVQRYVGVFSDISQLKAHEAELSRAANYDALTGMPNRLLLTDRLKQAIAQTVRNQNMMAVCYLDLDGFKPVNDTLGHEAGDQVLNEVARRIENTIRGGDTGARLGGDEFVVLLLGLEKSEECVATLERLLAVIAKPIIVNNNSLTLSASIGVRIYPLNDADPNAILCHADQAMYVAKQSGKNRFHIYNPKLDRQVHNQNECSDRSVEKGSPL